MNDNPDRITAPFDLATRVALTEWQGCAWAHPLTCGQCSCALPMIVEARGLVCIECFHVQESVPALCLSLPPEPSAVLGLIAYEVTFFLGERKPSAQHTFACNATSPAAAITMLVSQHPEAIMPFSVNVATGQGEGHREL